MRKLSGIQWLGLFIIFIMVSSAVAGFILMVAGF